MSRQPLDVVYRDKIEVSLDGRQIFYLFFGGAVIVGLVFVLGVMVGRRVEARGHVDRARTTAAQDPLAALDRLESNGGMSFRGSLMGAPGNSDVERQIREIEKARKPESATPAAVIAPAVAPPAPKVEEKKPEAPKPEVEQKPVTKPEHAKAEDKKPEAKIEAKPEAKIETQKPEPKKVEAKVETQKPEPKKEEKKPEEKKVEAKAEEKKPEEKKPDSDEKKSKYVLQLSSFQDRAEAEAFLAQIKGAGYAPFITEGTVNGTKFYRVRMGSYKSMDAANDAKSEIEKSLKKSATVMKI